METPARQAGGLVRQAAPHIHAFRGKTFVIAFGGEVLADGDGRQWRRR